MHRAVVRGHMGESKQNAIMGPKTSSIFPKLYTSEPVDATNNISPGDMTSKLFILG